MLYILGYIIFIIYLIYKINKFADEVNPYNWDQRHK
jgi:hypothetical protein